ncbi:MULTISPECIES: type II secretion system F family protein [unclassified Actinomyces]|uniref:type II secretion system F family protein n=1 Tax=unclassified Actinomyces TaxID=2609248 RepID=UPI002016D0E1|nr:type II secretion system F family protein [Actinomyces sp. 187325]MCL3778030.1 type II secretion system F family protein [Actinomyces sp. AC-20-1]MCL3789993.1 type II secretion system F family protein [Actinomyces sp. 187325]MCL3793818.1 type II secretion system F family protein [Actinomyces sp. 217892]
MSPVVCGALAGLALSCGLLVLASARRRARPGLVERLAPYVRERPRTSGLLGATGTWDENRTVSAGILAAIASVGTLLDRLGSSSETVRRRLEAAGAGRTLEQLRLEQMVWAGAGLAAGAGLGLATALLRPVSVPVLVLASLLAAVTGAAARDWWLTREVERRRARIEEQLPDVVELLALVVGAGQGPVAAIERIVSLGRGELIDELALTLAEVRSGTVLTTALTHLEDRVRSLPVTRLCEAVAVALERGTPLAEVLRAQASDAREASRRALMEEGGRREIAQMVPVVFLVLPITVVFALFPGLFVLRLGL